MTMRTSPAGIALLHGSEACRLRAYLDTGKLPTIGWGTTVYPDGRRVLMGDTCTQAQADAWFARDLARFERAVDVLTIDAITQQQFDALVNLTYNIGEPNYRTSTVRRLVNANPNDPAIRAAFMRWYKDNIDGDPALEGVAGLWARRHREADFYFGVTTPCPPFPGVGG